MIRAFEPADLDRVMDIWLTTNLAAHAFIDADYWHKNAETVRRLLPKSTLFVYEKAGTIAGFAGLTDDYLEGIFVTAAQQSQGIGRALLTHVRQGRTELSLNVYQKNRAALAFYLREGFVVHTEQRDKKTGEIELFMRWTK